jgi:hypothetical protein
LSRRNIALESRHEGKPLLRVLECYVLWSIGELRAKDVRLLKEMTPKLQKVYRTTGTWQDVIAVAMELPPNMPAVIRAVWSESKQPSRCSANELTPQRFAEMFVDQNLAS